MRKKYNTPHRSRVVKTRLSEDESTQIVTMHIQSVDQTAAIKTIKRIITELDRSKIEAT